MFLPAAVIARKRDGRSLSPAEIEAFVAGFAAGEIPDYQMSALAMAICCRGMDTDETFVLTKALLASGEKLQRRPDSPPRVDKHSTGGIGDKVSLILAPLLACCGVDVPMISGRGLGATGGTLDKLESIPGFQTNLTASEFESVLRQTGCVIAGATATLVPADRKLYALRDVTGTVPSIPLITASIMSKKLAEDLDALVLDVKHGSGAFMKSHAEATTLGRSMLEVGARFGVQTSALLTDMQQPLGRMIGNAVEVTESVEVLSGGGPADLIEVTLALGAQLLADAGMADSTELARELLQYQIDSGAGREKLAAMVAAQGGRLDTSRPVANSHPLLSSSAGYIASIDGEAFGLAVIELGGGRRQQGDRLDHAVGLELLVRIGDRIERGQPLLNVFAHSGQFERVSELLLSAISLSNRPLPPPRLIEVL
ncbi:MAG: thymidine phosphorylase [Planctomycetaceae bacterium]